VVGRLTARAAEIAEAPPKEDVGLEVLIIVALDGEIEKGLGYSDIFVKRKGSYQVQRNLYIARSANDVT